MFTTSFRIPVGAIHGAVIYVNGAISSATPFEKGAVIAVTTPSSAVAEYAEVIESVGTTRDPASYRWVLA